MSGTGIVEKRGYTRFPLKAAATIWRHNATVAGQVEDVSLGGAFIKLEPALSLYEAVTVSIHDSAKPEGLLSDLPATVVRTDDAGCGVRFERMLLERSVGDYMGNKMLGGR